MRPLLVLTIAAVAGASLLGLRWMVRGSADPFTAGWPLDLWIGSFALTLVLASLGRWPFTAACGLYVGFVVSMLIAGRAEYPVSSIIAFGVHGLVPAVAAALSFILSGSVKAAAGPPRK